VRLKERVTALERQGAGWRIVTEGGTTVDAEGVIVATEAYQAARLLRHADPALGHLLEDIPYASSATVTLGYRRAAIRHPLDGFGFVVPQVERRPVIAGTFSSVKYSGRAPDGHVLLRVFVGGALDEQAVAADDAAMIAAARAELAVLLGAEGEPLFTRVTRYVKAMPQYQVGHLTRVEAIESAAGRLPGLALAGGAYRGVGIADCVHSGEEAAERLVG
jgi:oxygen-dependent protoporphyrinogen oxidase